MYIRYLYICIKLKKLYFCILVDDRVDTGDIRDEMNLIVIKVPYNMSVLCHTFVFVLSIHTSFYSSYILLNYFISVQLPD